ncbi:MAG: tyrosine-type recombinase/integrase [Gammaproteobacteria bacterium]
MPTTTLTDKLCERVRAPLAGRIEYFDRNLPGFCLRVSGKGRKSFCLLYRVNGIKRRLTIGPYTGAGSLKAARDRARKALLAAAEGRDPATEKTQARRRGDTVGEVVEDYWRLHLAGLKDGQKAKRILDQEAVARWRYRRIGQITRRDIIEVIDEVAGHGTTGHADKVRAWVHALMNWCLSRDLIEHNPATALRRPHKTQIRSRVLGDEELRAIWQAAEGLGYPFGPVTQVLMLTGQRRGEVCGMRWADVDLDARLWVMAETKGGRPHVVPLVERSCAILGPLPRLGPYVFSTRGDRPVSGLSKCKQRLDRVSGIEGWIFHDLRRTVRTALARLGFEKHVCDRVLGHVTADISRHYDHWEYLPQKRVALAAWAEELERIIEGGAAKVVGISAKRVIDRPETGHLR